ncbi:MAG TPA: amino acid adenylation domain-containing protein [Thermoanaerobaculia bacterium]|nr:amino acid adenylation domain-containing protein [Thermoanaerobaculia bacterium]
MLYEEGSAAALPPLRADYDEHVRREQERLAGPRGERLWSFWSERLRDAPDLDLPVDRSRPARPFHRGGSLSFTLGRELTEGLRELARSRGATLFATLLAGFQALLARTAGQADFVVGAPAAGRSSADLAGTVGYFVHPLALRADLAGGVSGADLVDRARRTVREGVAHQALPFALLAERLRPVRVPGRSPLFQAMLVFHQARRPGEEAFPAFVLGRRGALLPIGEKLALDPIPLPPRDVPFDLTLILAEEGEGGLAAVLEFSADLFDPTTARRMAERFARLLAAIAADPTRRVDELPVAGEPELHQVLSEWNDTARAAGQPLGVYQRFAAQVARTPEAVAVVHGAERVTYEELDHRARELAAQLRRMGVGPERVVGVSKERGVEMVASLLGVMAAGGAYLPLDPALPRERLEWMLGDAGAGVVIGKDFKDGKDFKVTTADGALMSLQSFGSLAYVLYTSGSTGRPKGVAVTHSSVSALLDWAAETYSREEMAGVFAGTSIAFDISVFELFAPLSLGGTVILGENVLALHGLPAAREVTLVNTVPSAMAELLRQGPLPPSVRTVNLAGEPLPAELVRRIRGATGARVLNLYGPTEDTVYSTGAEVDGDGPPPIGRPLPGSRSYVLDADLRPVPLGLVGELWLAGAGLARGYLHRPDLTAERFLPDPLGEPGTRLYRTGDRARLRPDGQIELLGRVDHQVKVRGVRIELGEVEAALLRQPSVREAVADVREINGTRVLVAWVAGSEPTTGLRAAVAATLPSAMVPSLWVELPALPRTPSGKVDRRSLPAPELGGGGRARTAPRDAIEEALAEIWREALDLETVGVDDNFFDLGGHSLMAMRLLARIRHALGVELQVQELFERPTIALLARAVLAAPPRPAPPLLPIPRNGHLPLSYAQERLWFLDRLAPGSAVYNMPGAFLLRGPLRPDALAQAFSELARRHEVLRTRFVEVEGRPVQAIDPAAPVPLPWIDLSGLPEDRREPEERRIAAEEARRPFDLQHDRMLRTALVRRQADEHVLLITAHHIAADGWSMGLMAHEVAELVRASLAGRPPALPVLPVQYADFAQWQRAWMTDDVLAVQLTAWRDRLEGAPARLDLPADHPYPTVQSFAGGRLPFALPEGLPEALHALGRSRGASPFMVLAAALLTLLGRLTGSEDLLLGTPVANRRRVETEPLIGLFVNTLVLRGDLTGDPPFAALLDRVRETALAAYLHQDLPFEKLVEELAPERSLGHAPLVQVLLVLQNAAQGSLELPGLEVHPVAVDTGTSKLDLTLELSEDAEGLAGSIEYRRDLFDPATVEHLASSYATLLAAAVADPETPLSELPLLTVFEQRQVTTPERLLPRRPRPQEPSERPAAAPRSPTEEILASLWAELLGRTGFGPDDDFFAWGGHSLLGTVLVSRLRQTFGVELPVRALFEAPTLAGLAARVDEALGRPELAALPPIEPAPRTGPLPLSFAQQRLWLLDRLEPGGSAYNLPLAVRLAEPLDAPALESALAAVIGRHEALRTRFVEVNGEPAQEVALRGDTPVLPRIDLSALPGEIRRWELLRRLSEEAERSFDLAAGLLIRACLFRLGGESVLFLNLHHIASDGWSIGVLVHELGLLTRGETLPSLPIQFPDFAVWQRQWLQGEVLVTQLAWWRERLAGVPPLELPTDRPRPPASSYRGRHVPLALAEDLWSRVGAAARTQGSTPFMALLTALQAVLARWSGQTDSALGFPVANRRRPETEGLIGLFVNTLVLRGDLAGDPTGAELLRRTRDASLGAYAHQDLPFEKLVEELRPERNLGRSPLFQVLLALNAPLPEVEALDVHTRTSKFDLSWLWRERGGGLVGSLEHSTDLFDAPTALRLAGHFERLLAGLADDPESRISDLPLLSEAERAQLAREWNDTEEVPATTLPELIDQQVARTPEAVALVAGAERLTYAELDRRARELADHLRELGVGPEDRVAVSLERSAELVVALLAVWKAGGAYVPLDPAWPRERLEWMLEDSGAGVVVGKDLKDIKDIKDSKDKILALSSFGSFMSFRSFPSFRSSDSLAYVIYTSGSTGRPKGVAISHRSAAALALWAREVFTPEEMSGVLAATSVCFDLSIFELFVPLSLGGTVILAENALALPVLPAAGEVTLVNTVPSAMSELVRADALPASVRTICLAGEALRRDLVDRLLARPGLRILNLYGPSEDTTYSTFAEMTRDDRRPPAIGRPIPGTRAWLLDAAGHPVPLGAAGELCLGGAGLARGYLGRPELTAEKFVPGPRGGRLYRTGDLARARTDGSLEFLGRIDHQVKVRGFRIEPGEIEAALVAHPAVHAAAVVVRETDSGDRLLVAWLTVEEAAPSPGELREWLLARLPEPYVPGLFAVLDALPLTPNGKVDRTALARRPLPGHTTASQAPRTPLESAVAAVWAETLGVERVGVDDDFFALGGHSLLAARLVARLREALGVELPLRAVFEAPTVERLARRVETARPAQAEPPLVPVPRMGDAPLSFAQERLWFLDRLEGGASLNMAAGVRLAGDLVVSALAGALAEVERRHEVLRTRFPEVDGRPRQIVSPAAYHPLPLIDVRGVPAEAEPLRNDIVLAPFDLAAGPAWRALLLRFGDREHELVLAFHHIVTDGWSIGLFTREVAALYEEAAGLPQPPIQYTDFAVWQRSQELDRQLAFWRERLAGDLPAEPLSPDWSRSTIRRSRAVELPRLVPPAMADALRSLGQAEGASLYMILLAALGVLLGRHGGSTDVVIGSPVAGRTRPETEGVIGCFLNTLALRLSLEKGSFRQLLVQARDTVLEALAHQEVPFERILEEVRPERDAARTPLFQVLLNMQNFPRVEARLPGLDLELKPGPITPPRFDLTVYAEEAGDALQLRWVWDAGLFEPARREEIADQLGFLLEQIARDPDAAVEDLSLVTPRAAERLPDPAVEIAAAWHGTIQGRFTQQALRRPGALAVVDREVSWTYGDLLRGSRQVAQALRAQGVRPGDVVAIHAHRSAALVRAVLGVLQAGGVFLILDRDYPEARRAAITQAARPKTWLSTADPTDPTDHPTDRTDPTDPSDATHPDAPAYLAFTSGSTGAPKGIVGPQRPLSHFLDWHVRTVGLEASDRFSLLSGLSHDPLLRDLFTPLWLGATLVIPDPDQMGAPGWLAEWMARERISVAHLTPAMAQLLTGTAGDVHLPALRRAFFGGDALLRRDVARLRALAPEVTCVNFYGATETPQAMGWHVVDPAAPDDGRPVPLGRGIEGAQLLVLTETGRLAGVGEVGEIHIRTPYLALGYLDDPALTRERFLPGQLYRTGDLGAYLPDGQVRPLGRADRQIKIRGFRVEPAEIEAALARQEGVREALVLLRGERLVAYVVPATPSPAALRQALRDTLPSYMVPAAIVALDALPLTPNGKVDRAALPDPEHEEAGFVAPRDPIEALLAEIWAGVLGLERVGAFDEFFALGGHSLLATQVVSRIRESFGVDLPLRALFEAPTLESLARRIEEARRGGTSTRLAAPPIHRIPREGELPLSFAQQRLWFLDQMEPGNPNLHLATALRLTGPLDVSALAAALQEVVRRHETLRTTFGARDGRPWQTIAPELKVPLPVVDLGGLPEATRQHEERRLIPDLAWKPFDLSRGPLLRAVLLDFGDGSPSPGGRGGDGRGGQGVRSLALTLHHLVSDGWSTGVLFDELTLLYEAFRTGRPSPLPPLPVQYVDFAAWQRDWLRDDVLAEQLASWRATLGESGFPMLELPTDRPRPAVPTFRGARRPVLVPRELATALQTAGRERGATLFMLLMAAFQTLLHRSTGQDELLVGSPVASRTRVEVERLIGMFFNLLAFRADLADDPAFSGLLARVRDAALTAYLHQDLPFEKLLEELQPERQLSRTPLFQVTLVLQNAPRTAIELPGLTLTPLEIDSRSANFDLNLQLTETPQGIAGWLEYRTDLFDAPTIDRMASHLLHLLEGVVADPGQRLSRLQLLAPHERFQLLTEWNDTREPFPENATLHGLFETQAKRTPDALAVISAERSLTYRQLDEESARLAVHLRSQGVGPGVPVAVSLERTAGMIPALLGILRAGGFYVPLERSWPEARVASILSTLAIKHVLTQFPPLPEEGRGWERGPGGEGSGGDGIAYVIFTSGSTGVPKGVMVQHRPVINLVQWVNRTFGVGPGDRVLFVTSLAFDLSVYDVFGMLAAGGTVRIASEAEAHDPEALAGILGREPITFWDSAPAALAQVVPFLPAAAAAENDRSHLRLVFLSGDWIPLPLPGAMREAFPSAEVIALGGATEATIWSNVFPVGELAPHRVSIPYGRPIPNARYHLLEAGFEPCPIGVPGDLYIGGDCLSFAYAGDPELTASKYLPDPWSGDLGGRLYRTGDRARLLPDGTIEFLGRIDHQVKIRGFRIELGEIEAALLAHPAVREAVAVARAEDGPRSEKRLVAYVVQDPAYTGEDDAENDAPETLVDRWQAVYDGVYSRHQTDPTDPTDRSDLNLAGWNSSYTGEPLPEAEMRAWVEATVERILDQGEGRRLGRVLEIGCGTGMLLFRIAPRCASYYGTDLSEVSLHSVRRQLAARGLDNVTLAQRAADDWSGIAPGSFDAVILNSVTQHFPGIDYLRRVVEGAVRAVRPGGFLFVGDVRSLPLLHAFHASIQLAQAPDGLTRPQLDRRVRQRAAQEEELLVDPRFFTALGAGLPEVDRVEIQLKRGRDRNEMSRFRFDAVLHVGAGQIVAAPVAWHDWSSLPHLREILTTERPAALGLRGVPDDRLREEAAILDWLENDGGPETAGEFRRALERMPASGLEPEDLWELGRELGYQVEVRSGDSVGQSNVVFRSVPPLPGGRECVWERGLGGEGPGAAGSSWASFANNPLQGVIARKLVPRLRAWLTERVPESMLPSAIVPLDTLPLTPNGKVDRKALPAPDSARPELEAELVAPRTAAERQLAAIWCEVLGVDRVGVHDNFFGLGGDSILSIQVIARAQQAGLRLTPRQLFQHQTIAGLAAVAQNAETTTEEQGPVTGRVPLTPIQRWFFEQELEDPHHYNLALMLELREEIRPGHLERVTARLLEHHDALRLRFHREGSGWVQENDPPGAPVPCSVLDLSALPAARRIATLESAAAELQKSLDLETGPLQRFALFRCGSTEPDRLLLTVHHLVIDGVSWRILLEDLQTGLRQAERGEAVLFPPKTTSYRRWAEALAGHIPSEEEAFWLDPARRSALPLPGDGPAGANLEGTARTVKVGLDAEETRTLLREVPEAFQTRIDDVLLTALVRAFSRWTGSRSLLIDLEGHGRGEILPDVDLSRTVGWFTAIYPMLLEVGGAPEEDLKSIKEQLRRVPSGGAGYGLLRYGETEMAGELARLPQPQVIFNDLGQFDSLAGEDALIRPARESFGATRSPRARRRHLLEIYATVLAGRLELDFEFSANVHRESTIQRLAGWFLDELRRLIERCRAASSEGTQGFTPSDFPEADLNQEDLDLILEQLT